MGLDRSWSRLSKNIDGGNFEYRQKNGKLIQRPTHDDRETARAFATRGYSIVTQYIEFPHTSLVEALKKKPDRRRQFNDRFPVQHPNLTGSANRHHK